MKVNMTLKRKGRFTNFLNSLLGQEVASLSIITVSRQMASYGDEIALAVSKKLGWELFTRETVLKRFFEPIVSLQDYNLLRESARFFRAASGQGQTYRDLLQTRLLELAGRQSAVLIGFGSQIIFSAHPDAIHVRIIAPEEVRLERVQTLYNVSADDARRILATADKKHRRFVTTVFDADSADPERYDMVLNTADLSVEAATAAILAMQQQQSHQLEIDRQIQRQLAVQPDRPEVIQRSSSDNVFKNASEEEFAHILDMYQIDWVYEPRTFPIEWDAEGNVTLAFSPDFYLPQFNTYLELTTMSQKYVTQKNKKAKRLQELYPGVHVKIVYKKNYQSLIDRFSQL